MRRRPGPPAPAGAGCNPSTCDLDYSKAQLEFMKAIEDYKQSSGRMYPTWSEVLEVLVGLGYEKPATGERSTRLAARPERTLSERPIPSALHCTEDGARSAHGRQQAERACENGCRVQPWAGGFPVWYDRVEFDRALETWGLIPSQRAAIQSPEFSLRGRAERRGPVPMTAILGISAFYHDSAAALVVDGESWPRRRRSGSRARSTTPASPRTPSPTAWREAGLTPGRLDYVGFYDKPLLKFERLLETYLAYAPRGLPRRSARRCRSGCSRSSSCPAR